MVLPKLFSYYVILFCIFLDILGKHILAGSGNNICVIGITSKYVRKRVYTLYLGGIVYYRQPNVN
jgi:hypothetical protein